VGAQGRGGHPTTTAQASAAVRVTRPGLSIGKAVEDGQNFAVAGAPITFTITLTNTGDTRLDQIAVADIYDTSHFVWRAASPLPSQSSAGHLRWDDLTAQFGDLLPGGVISFTASFTVTTTASSVTNRVRIESDLDENGDALFLSASEAVALVVIDVAAISLELKSKPPAQATVRPGDCIVYDLTVTNTGQTNLTNTELTAFPPEGTTRVEECPPTERSARYAAPQNHEALVVWQMGMIAPGRIITRQLQVVINANLQVNIISLMAEVRSDQSRGVAFTGQAANPLDPTAVTLLRFSAASQPGGVQVDWITGVEVNSWGFHLWRTDSPAWADPVRATDALIPAQGRDGSGAAYRFFDPVGQTGDWYWLQEIENDGTPNLYGPVWADAVTEGVPERRIFLPRVER
ncbi:MAG: DUF11 domain-containing protein, partial [Chloroflexi bacterium]